MATIDLHSHYPDLIVNKVIERREGLSYKDARELIRYLDDVIDYGTNFHITKFSKGTLGLTFTEYNLVQTLYQKAPEVVHYHTLFYVIQETSYKDHKDLSNQLKVYIYRIRAKLKPYNLTITTERLVGYRMDAETKEKWDALFQESY